MLEKVPTLLTVAVLAVIFAFLERHVRSGRSRMWKIGWFLVFIHFLAQLFEPAGGQAGPFISFLDWGSLQASAVAFIVASASIVEEAAKRMLLVAIIGLPSVAYTLIGSWDVQRRWPYVACLLACFAGGIGFLFVHRKMSMRNAGILAVALGACGFWGVYAALHGSFDPGAVVLLGAGFALPGVLMFLNDWRPSPGVLTVVIGFLFWGAVFPAGMLTASLMPQVQIPGEIWNIPKMFVAFGMVLTVVEDMRAKEKAKNIEMQRFSAITSQLLGGATVDSLCGEVAAAISEVTNFRVALVHLADAGRSLRLVGASGVPQTALPEMREQARQWTTKDIEEACGQGRMVGTNSFLISATTQCAYLALYRSPQSTANPGWNRGNQAVIPMRTAQGGCLGCIVLGDPRNPKDVNASQLLRIELLVADLAVALELKSLQAQLARSEKLAALGQMLAGVAHELNNPLAAVMGYGELLGDEVSGEPARVRLEKMLKESRRMKRIIDKLLQFSRQGSTVGAVVDLGNAIREVLALHQYCMRARNFETVVEIQPGLKPISFDEDQIKQVLLNLLGNAADAVQHVKHGRKITVRAFERESMAVLEIEDCGTGFDDIDRAFDPFYTTKPVGKGTGLGLSICYGIVKKHGGEIYAENLPTGARVTLKLPFAQGIEVLSVLPDALACA